MWYYRQVWIYEKDQLLVCPSRRRDTTWLCSPRFLPCAPCFAFSSRWLCPITAFPWQVQWQQANTTKDQRWLGTYFPVLGGTVLRNAARLRTGFISPSLMRNGLWRRIPYFLALFS